MEIRKAELSDLEDICEIIEECKKYMAKKGDEQWPDTHPSKEKIKEGVEEGEHFVAIENGNVVGGLRICGYDPGYDVVDWSIEDENPAIVHRLAVSPNMQGKGIAKALMGFVEEYAIGMGSGCVRLDTYINNHTANKFYQELGYQERGRIMMPWHMPKEYICYEKIIA
jgi:ribosomal protein S18 acetylase RimI-like enzyme